ncbi:hypothetical protein GCM10009731_13550 [Streptomyces globosus]
MTATSQSGHRSRRMRATLVAAAVLAAATTFGSAGPAHAASVCFNGLTPLPVVDGEINGTEGADDIRCLSLTNGNTLNGLGGDDTIRIIGLVGSLGVYGGSGNDTITVRATLSGGFGNTALVSGGDGDDVLTLGGLERNGAEARGDAGNDTLNIGVIDPGGRAEGNDGDDLLQIDSNASTVMAGAGNDTIQGLRTDRMSLTPGSFTDAGDGTDTCRLRYPGTGSPAVAGCEATP